jgi:hypothetical protein
MNHSSLIHFVSLVLLLFATFGRADDPNGEPARLALLVGVQKYRNLAEHEQLAGCENDTRLMRQVLIERYGFSDSSIEVLTNEQATGDAIRQSYAKLVARVRALPANAGTAQIVFHFSGHGSQVADQPEGDPNCDEQDGLDETLVPYDATKQGGPEDIRDDELFDWVDELCADEKARVWMILDCCHSGTGARGSTRFRSLERGRVLALEPSTQESRRVTPKRLPEGAVLLAACRANEKEPEYEEARQHYGLLTRFVVETLNKESSVSRLSFDRLRESLGVQYRLAGVMQAPTPQLEGGRNAIVLGANESLDRKPIWKVQVDGLDRSSATLAAGAIHGVTVGSLFQVYERPDQVEDEAPSVENAASGPSVAWLRIDRVDGSTATAKCIRWEQAEQITAAFPKGLSEGYAIERQHEHGDFVLRVRVVRASEDGTDSPPHGPGTTSLPTAVRDMLSSGAQQDVGESRWLHWSTSDESYDVVLRCAGEFAAIFPATGKSAIAGAQLATRGGAPTVLRGGWGPIDLRSPNAHLDLLQMLRRINRVRNLTRIAAMQPTGSTGTPSIALQLSKIEIDNGYNIIRETAWPSTRDVDGYESMMMRDGAYYTVRVTNLEPVDTGKPIYVTVLHIDGDMGIDVLWPFQEGATEEQKLLPGESRYSGPFVCNHPDELPIHGLRTAIVLATREPNDFEILAQPSLPLTRGTVARSNRSLDDLLIEQTYFQTRGGTTRLRPRKLVDDSWSTQTVQWMVTP